MKDSKERVPGSGLFIRFIRFSTLIQLALGATAHVRWFSPFFLQHLMD